MASSGRNGRLTEGVTEGETTLSNFAPTKLYYRIGEVSRLTGVKPYVLRYWETEFKWMTPHKSRSRQRLYRPKDIEMVFLIKQLLHEERFTIAGARKRLKEIGVDQAKAEAGSGGVHLRADARRAGTVSADFRRIKDELAAIRALI
jgi:DNA-binding transcriptional MerR regulator